jgi:long-chain acyl-CoA synthetase
MAKVLGIQPQDVLITTRQFSNAASINIHVLLPIVAGCKVVVMEKFNRFETARAIAREKVTVIQAVPFVYEMLASIPATYPINFSSLRLCISGGAALARSVFDSFYKRFGIFLRQRYTGTQVSPAFTYSDCDIAGAVGHVGGFFPVAILDDEGRELGPERIGEIAFDVSKVKDPFWKKQIKANRNRRGNYVHSGDLGKTDVAGNVFVVGRKSPFIKVGGNRVEPAEVESVLLSHPRVKEAVVFATQPGQADEGVGAVVVPRGRLKREDLLVYCGERLDSYKCPRKIELRKNLPRNAQGKVIRYLFDRSAAGSLPQDE